jgi:hypothetical protein
MAVAEHFRPEGFAEDVRDIADIRAYSARQRSGKSVNTLQ